MSTAATAEELALTLADDASQEQRFAGAEVGAFEQVVALYQVRVARLASRLLGWRADVDDVVQDVFLTALSKAHTFRSESSLWTWLTAITVNRCRSQQRRAALFAKFVNWSRNRSPQAAPAADRSSLGDEAAQQVQQAVWALPITDREVIVLSYLEGRTPAEMSGLLGLSINAVEVRLHRARKKLKVSLAQWAQE
jgi:RNA polymerase sigma-70 factor (ECF subfamily)